ncbi:MAG: 2-C-methyl-D-erythritol 2,4-cyclodiphosphate synthase [Actinomycetia bacterium]|nr:2-C-methyl-D-erythritol 2,4-cyclodiphosphate synthase [Actinomycetes bacterium]
MSLRVGLGYDVHPFGGSGDLVLGGVTIGHARLEGHSDADVVAHAVTDAVLGAAGLPDLGTMFPAADPHWKDASSIRFLEVAAERVAAAGWWVENVDVVVAAEVPRLAPHLEAMAANLSAALDDVRGPSGDPVFVAVKPKRGEGIGAIGRSEGIAAWAVALLQR